MLISMGIGNILSQGGGFAALSLSVLTIAQMKASLVGHAK